MAIIERLQVAPDKYGADRNVRRVPYQIADRLFPVCNVRVHARSTGRRRGFGMIHGPRSPAGGGGKVNGRRAPRLELETCAWISD